MRLQDTIFVPLFLAVSAGAAADAADVASLRSQAERAGLRVIEGEHLVLATDRPPRDRDGVGDLPRIFDEAFSLWCRHYRLEKPQRGWRAFGCLMVDRERFHAAGLLPTGDALPDFKNGYCAGDRFWLMDQSSPDYRRHLLLHEGVHAFTLTLRAATAPPWYTEGIAEYLAMHRLDRDAGRRDRLVPTPVPQRAGDVERLGRIEKIRALRATQAMPSLADVFRTPPAAHHELGAYAASWAAVAILALHPAHAKVFSEAEREPLDERFTQRLEAIPGWDGDRAARDFDAFTDEVDYGYDFARSGIDWSPGRPLESPQRIEVASDRGWQNSGWALAKGRRYALKATGRFQVGQASACLLESEPDGISLRWYRGRPIGRLLAGQWVEHPREGGRPRFVILAEGAAGEFEALTDGPLHLKINESPGDLADNAGKLSVELK